ncbi:hypothetical protein D3C87_2198960 [compost metagenome]
MDPNIAPTAAVMTIADHRMEINTTSIINMGTPITRRSDLQALIAAKFSDLKEFGLHRL